MPRARTVLVSPILLSLAIGVIPASTLVLPGCGGGGGDQQIVTPPAPPAVSAKDSMQEYLKSKNQAKNQTKKP